MTTAILTDLDPSPGANVLAFVNGLGGTPLIELYLVYNELTKQLEGHGLTASRNLVGNYITSLEMAGVSITLLVLDDELTALWDAPVHTPALRWGPSRWKEERAWMRAPCGYGSPLRRPCSASSATI